KRVPADRAPGAHESYLLTPQGWPVPRDRRIDTHLLGRGPGRRTPWNALGRPEMGDTPPLVFPESAEPRTSSKLSCLQKKRGGDQRGSSHRRRLTVVPPEKALLWRRLGKSRARLSR